MKLIPFAGKEYRAPARIWTDDRLRLEALFRWREGWNTFEIATFLGVPEATIYNLNLSKKEKVA
ncbi:helix-turn-helix domain-containing protein [Martelella lutilitoris]|uniref:Helix-turn-helix domain-containing protein n=1 Tax=Martelella lutilitoris TaxID=2583532 RepID=A0A7T7HHQ5_9HYPH|nr:helix-turn-helix domain-containing protein [Martelella lutilitoris]QQM29323.1 helix-turn-helix domain-containing protein [Martelella lutilitoris]